jgi:hypothetical protein
MSSPITRLAKGKLLSPDVRSPVQSQLLALDDLTGRHFRCRGVAEPEIDLALVSGAWAAARFIAAFIPTNASAKTQ